MRRSYQGIAINTSKNTHETVLSLIGQAQNAKLVDIPCGAGAFIARLQDSGYSDILGIDIRNIIQIPHDGFKVGDMTQVLPLDDASVNAVICIDGIEHINRQADFVREVCRVLAAGGEFIISTPNISSLRSRWKWFATGHHHKCNSPLDEDNPNPSHHISMISLPELRYMLHTNGFQLNAVTTNRMKLANLIYALFLPFIYLATSWTYYRAGRKQGTTKLNQAIKQSMFSRQVLFGETLIVKAIKQ